MVTRPPLRGSTLGASYIVFRPLAVGLVVNEPQSPPVPAVHAAAQVTPFVPVVGSFATVALIAASADSSSVDGGVNAADVQLMEMLFASVIVTVAIAVATGVATVVAMIVTTPPALVGIMEGAE